MRFFLKLKYPLIISAALCCTVVFLATENFIASFLQTPSRPTPSDVYPAIIVGGGIGGLTAAVHLAQQGLTPLVLEGATPGGLLTLSHSVRNWPGTQNIPGDELVAAIKQHAHDLGTTFKQETAVSLDCSAWPYKITTEPDGDGHVATYKTTSIILATGTTPRMLAIPGEQKYWGKGVSNCAICDGALYKNKNVAVIGGGQAAIEEAGYLATLASKVYMIVRKPHLKSHEASRIQALRDNSKVTLLTSTVPLEIKGNDAQVSALEVMHLTTQQKDALNVAGIFEAIGSIPNSKICGNKITCSHERTTSEEPGHIQTQAYGATNIAGVFAVGDVTKTRYHQAIMVAGQATEASMAAVNYILQSGHHNIRPLNKTPLSERTLLQQQKLPSLRFPADTTEPLKDIYPVIIVGGGAAGLTAAIYLGYAGYKPLLFEGQHPGGSLAKNGVIETWPNIEKISGNQLAHALHKHAQAAGADLIPQEVASISYATWPYTVTTKSSYDGKANSYRAACIILAPGAPTESLNTLTAGLHRNSTAHVITTPEHETNKPGVFAIGDLVAPTYNQPLIGAGQGAEAALNACETIRDAGYQQPQIKNVTPTETSAPIPTPLLPEQKSKHIPHLSTINEFKKVLNSGKDLVIDCFATWCPPCRALKPTLDTMHSTSAFPDVDFYGVDVDEAENLATLLQIQGLPTLLFFSNKKEVARISGFKDKAWLSRFITKTFKKP